MENIFLLYLIFIKSQYATIHPMNIAFFGTPAFTTDFLDTLVTAEYSPSLVVTGPDRPFGRGMVMTPPEPKVWATAHSVKVLQPENLMTHFLQNFLRPNGISLLLSHMEK